MSGLELLGLLVVCLLLAWAWLKLVERLSPRDEPDPSVYDWDDAWD